jgi:hypothetical protein
MTYGKTENNPLLHIWESRAVGLQIKLEGKEMKKAENLRLVRPSPRGSNNVKSKKNEVDRHSSDPGLFFSLHALVSRPGLRS